MWWLKRLKEKTSNRKEISKRGTAWLRKPREIVDEFTFPAGLITHVCSRYELNQGAYDNPSYESGWYRVYYVPVD